MVINIYPQGYAREIMHEADRENNPEKHRFNKDSYSRFEMQKKCIYCIEHHKEWLEKWFEYDACTDRYYKRKRPEFLDKS